MLWYGPGYIKPGVTVKRPVTLADIADTQAALLNFPFHSIDGHPMTEALLPASQRQTPPKLIVTLVWDAGGMDTLGQFPKLGGWPNAWPNLKALIPQGTWFSDATVGTSPTSTAQDHAVIGTGDFPKDHMLVAHHFRVGDTMTTPWALGSRLLDQPTLADLYDRANNNKPIIAGVGSVAIHLGMMSHGAAWGGGDKDIAVLTNVNNPATVGAEGPVWSLPQSLQTDYTFPSWITNADGTSNVPGYPQAKKTLDQADGKLDGKWRDQSIQAASRGFDTPARIPWETNLVNAMLHRIPLGQDSTPDMLFINYKVIDYVSHVQSMDSKYMLDAVTTQDANLPVLINDLNATVGKGNWVLNLTADHGAMPSPQTTGAFVASPGKIGQLINAKFGTGTIMLTQNTTAFLNVPLLESNGYTVDQVANYVSTFTLGQTYLVDAANTYKPTAAHANDKLFTAAFPSSILSQLPCLSSAPLD
jgi:hypothetical protein